MHKADYYQSPPWKRKAADCRARAGYRCQLCASGDGLQCHHNTYQRFGHEKQTDLVCLCRKCHREYHDRVRMAAPWFAYVPVEEFEAPFTRTAAYRRFCRKYQHEWAEWRRAA